MLDEFLEVWLVDFEFSAPPGERPTPVCLVGRELRTGRTLRLFQDDLRGRRVPPYPTGPNTLFVAYYASAELSCHLALGWPMPSRVLDLCVEFRGKTAGLGNLFGHSLLGALAHHGLDAMGAEEKDAMRALVIRGGPWADAEQRAILDYCESDVEALARLLPAMLPTLDLPHALLRGRYMAAVARMEWVGTPIDTQILSSLSANGEVTQDRLIADVDREFNVFNGRTFKADRWRDWLIRNGIAWPRLESGALAMDEETFKEMGLIHPQVGLMRELRASLSQMRLTSLTVGADGRNRCLLSAFGSKTGRNQPSNSKFIFGASAWLRGLIRPEPGRAIAYVDWNQQEFGIAAALSNDPAMMAAYASGDPYLAFGKQAGQIPPDGTKATYGPVRELMKVCVLGVQYAMSEWGLARRLEQPSVVARGLLRMHHEAYPMFWRWSDAAVDHAMLYGELSTVFGWTVRVGRDNNPRSLRNFPMQANGAEMLRLACCLASERGIAVCAPVHDAILVEGADDRIDDIVTQTQAAMSEASGVVLDGFLLRSDAKVVRWPERYMDERGQGMWDRVMRLLPGTGSPN